jgi:C-terminal processing protease CtpA/Prc
VAFTRLFGYVRYFHPSDSASHTDWHAFAIRAIPLVENAREADDLTRVLNRLFQPIAPAVTVYRSDRTPPAPPRPPASPTLGAVFWEHFGLGGSMPSVYRSIRRLIAAPDGEPPSWAPLRSGLSNVSDSVPVPSPLRPPRFDLGGGVSAVVPLALFTTADHLTDSIPRPSRVPTDSTAPPNRATRLAVVACLWNVAQHFYPYFDVVSTNWDSVLVATLTSAAVEPDPDRFYVVLERMVAALHDGHGMVYSARNEALRLFYAHPPVRLGMVEGRIIVTGLEDSAVAAGVHLGEEVVSIDGRPAADVLAEREARTSGATAGFVQFVALRQMVVGPPGSVITFTLRVPFEHKVRFVRVPGPMRFGGLPDKVAELRDGIMYVDLGRITDTDFAVALPRLKAASGIVFDMRSYPRSVSTPPILAMLSDVPLHSAPFEVPVITAPDHRNMHFVEGGWPVPAAATRLRARVAFLIGPGVVSYGETTMGMVEAYHLGAMVGSTTAGTNGNVNLVALPGGYRLRFTGMRVLKHDGSPLHGVGIRPTVAVVPTLRGVWDGRDEVLERAVTWLASSQ